MGPLKEAFKHALIQTYVWTGESPSADTATHRMQYKLTQKGTACRPGCTMESRQPHAQLYTVRVGTLIRASSRVGTHLYDPTPIFGGPHSNHTAIHPLGLEQLILIDLPTPTHTEAQRTLTRARKHTHTHTHTHTAHTALTRACTHTHLHPHTPTPAP